ncbi:MAG: family 1 extracellular solute-binding protein [Paenibacillaceae bacterium]|nr:family 1 extracellular solute-binding protein [Paenibacillaceae bacterium]
MIKVLRVLTVLSLVLVWIAGCGTQAAQPQEGKEAAQKEPGKAVEVSTDPVTLQFFQGSANISDDEFTHFVVEPVKKKYPYITLELVRTGPGQTIGDLITAGTIPDIFFVGLGQLSNLEQLGLSNGFPDLIKKHNFDLSQIEPDALTEIKSSSTKGDLNALPFSDSFSAMYYNMDIFDKYGVSYPKDSSTWDDIVELSRQISTKSGGQTLAVNPGSAVQFGSALSLPVVDAKTHKAVLTTDKWKKVVDMYKLLNDISPFPSKANQVFYEQKLAMLADQSARVGELEQLYNEGKPLNWNVTTYPSFKEAPGKRRTMGLHNITVSSQSKHKDQAFLVLSTMLDHDNQLKITQNGRLSALKDPKIKEQFGKDLKSIQGKNVASIFKSVPALSPPATDYDALANKELNAAVKKVLSNAADANSALREAEEKANQAIAAAQ